ncbi:unnamed protein product [Hymenolepis diminuta]|uniref:Dolichol-phosphate mannosyltransferase subunit 3 n=1 Tax=Hymenolepis diminuta TaxID=6216 RepID=A0A0R3SFT9_HYMDI|nr:unnamed protein product [Hymenolepis diminuta]
MIRAVPWISAGILFIAIWLGALHSPFGSFPAAKMAVLLSPIVIIFFFGIFSLSYIMYGVFTFNDCPGEDEKLKKQIEEARKGLKNAGYKF